MVCVIGEFFLRFQYLLHQMALMFLLTLSLLPEMLSAEFISIRHTSAADRSDATDTTVHIIDRTDGILDDDQVLPIIIQQLTIEHLHLDVDVAQLLHFIRLQNHFDILLLPSWGARSSRRWSYARWP
uniref:Putative secreted protein n=1 Tax=Anopheles darlingi TaxID=43151 RepID=A0A2M4DA60_ANODA